MLQARWWVLLVFVITCSVVIPAVDRLQNDDDVLAFLPPDHPEVVRFRAVAEKFGMLEVALVGLGVDEGDVLAPQRVEQIRTLGRALDDVSGVRAVLTFADLPDPRLQDDGLTVAPLVPEGVVDADEIRSRVLGSRDAVGNLVSADGRAAAILVFLDPRTGNEGLAGRRAVLREIRELTEGAWTAGSIYWTGAPFIETAAAEASRHDIERLSPIVIAVLGLTSALLLGSFAAAAINLCVTGLGVGLVIGAHGLFGEPLTIVSSSLPVMMVALGGAFGVHIIAGFQRQPGTHRERATATLRELWLPVLLSGLTTAVSFFALVVMPQAPMRRFGLTAGAGVLLLLLLALVVLPALLSILPSTWLPTRVPRPLRLRARPPALVAWVLAGLGAWVATGLKSNSNTDAVFDAESAPRLASTFFAEHFGGSTYLQVAISGDLAQPGVVRAMRDLSDSMAEIEGVADVRSVVEPIAVVNAALGGRQGVPEDASRGGRVLTYLIGHPAMAQLMTQDAQDALIHVKLAPVSDSEQVTERLAVLVAAASGEMRELPADDPRVGSARLASVGAGLTHQAGVPVDLTGLGDSGTPSARLLAEIERLRDEVLDPERGPVAVVSPPEQIASLLPEELGRLRGAALLQRMRSALPVLEAADAEGLRFAAEHLEAWIAQARVGSAAQDRCETLGLAGKCEELAPRLSELDDRNWTLPVMATGGDGKAIPFAAELTGQPRVGQAFAESVTRSLWQATAVSVAALAIVLALSGTLHALIPALWTLAVSLGAIALLGHTLSIGTSMVTCIALGAGVDFAIHLGVRARSLEGERRGARAVEELGSVALVSAAQLAAAFLVLAVSEMPPLREFGVGLAIALSFAAVGAVWLVGADLPGLVPASRIRGKRADL